VVYLVGVGEYDDYHVVAVFADADDAARWARGVERAHPQYRDTASVAPVPFVATGGRAPHPSEVA